MNNNFKVIYAAKIVPLKSDKSIDTENLIKHVKEISNVKGIRCLLVNGHAGENFTLSADEQIQVLNVIKESIKNDSLIISGVNFEDPEKGALVA